MDSSLDIIFTPFNYHEWKAKIGILLRNKGLNRVYMDLENDPIATVEKYKWHNRFYEAYGFICFSIPPGIIFHLDGFTTLR